MVIKNFKTGIFFICIFMLMACNPPPAPETVASNPPAKGFNETESDAKAIAIADEVMEAMGGRKAWDETEVLSWKFFGRRTLIWDKKANEVVIEIPADSLKIELQMNDMSGNVYKSGVQETQKDSIQKYLGNAKNIWINDSYWLVMPFKLKDSGVTLTYVGKDTTAEGIMSDKLGLTFDGVGVTPNNKYEVLVGDQSRLVEEWRFYTNANDSIPRFATPWSDYEKHGEILLSGGRGRMALSDISVSNSVKDE